MNRTLPEPIPSNIHSMKYTGASFAHGFLCIHSQDGANKFRSYPDMSAVRVAKLRTEDDEVLGNVGRDIADKIKKLKKSRIAKDIQKLSGKLDKEVKAGIDRLENLDKIESVDLLTIAQKLIILRNLLMQFNPVQALKHAYSSGRVERRLLDHPETLPKD